MAIQRRYPFSWMMKDFEDMLAEIENRLWGPGGRFLPAAGVTDRVLPAIRGEFRVDVRDNDDEIMVVADLPGVDKEDISIALLSPNTLEISCERRSDKEEQDEGYYVRERVYGTMARTVVLPHEVTDKGASATFKNGVLEVRLKKSKEERGNRIKIE